MYGQIRFFANQYIDAMLPVSFVFTISEVLRATIDSNGESLVSGVFIGSAFRSE